MGDCPICGSNINGHSLWEWDDGEAYSHHCEWHEVI
jgi:hypothetical protein